MINIKLKLERAVCAALNYLLARLMRQRLMLPTAYVFQCQHFFLTIFYFSLFSNIFLISLSQAADENATPVSASKILPTQKYLPAQSSRSAKFYGVSASNEARHVADWVVHSSDNGHMPFVIVDKRDARVFVFDAAGQLIGSTQALLGLALGDDSPSGIGERKLHKIRPDERTTPAGRFVASLGRNLRGEDILWVDYHSGVSMHRVKTNNPKERRLERLSTSTALDNRISYGCINVPVRFYEKIVSPTFTGTSGVDYVLPEIKQMREIFNAYYSVEQITYENESRGSVH